LRNWKKGQPEKSRYRDFVSFYHSSRLSYGTAFLWTGVFRMEKPKIRFVDALGNTLFYLDDGEEIELEVGDEWIRYTCRYMDDYHFKLGDYIYHIGQFAQEREKLVQRYRPVNPIKEEKTLCKKRPAKRSGN
jgi:hypothetical protein